MSIIPVAQQYTYLLSYSSKVPELELLRDNIQERYQRHRDEANPTECVFAYTMFIALLNTLTTTILQTTAKSYSLVQATESNSTK